MPKKITPSSSRKRKWAIHLVIYFIGVFLMWFFTYHNAGEGFVYPWPSWITAAWGLALIGHTCLVFANYEDKGYKEFSKQAYGEDK